MSRHRYLELRIDLFSQHLVHKPAYRDPALVSLNREHLDQVFVYLNLKATMFELRVHGNFLEAARIVRRVMGIPELRRLFIAGELIWNGVNSLRLFAHSSSALSSSYRAPRWARLLSDTYG